MNKREEIDRLLVGKEYLKGGLLYCRSVYEVKGILELSYFDNPKYSHLLTSGIFHKTASEVKEILELPYFDMYPELLTSSIWSSNVSNIKKVFENKIIMSNPNLLKPSIFSISLKNVDPVYKLFEEYGIENYITINSFRRDISKQRSLFIYMEDNNIPFLVGDDNNLKLNPMLNASNAVMKRKYGIDVNDLYKRGACR